MTLKPEPVFTPLGTNATFRCETSEDYVEVISWRVTIVNFEIAVRGNSEEQIQILANKGIYFQWEGALTILTMAARAENNQTHITCSDLSSIPHDVITVQLIVTGIVLGYARNWFSNKYCVDHSSSKYCVDHNGTKYCVDHNSSKYCVDHNSSKYCIYITYTCMSHMICTCILEMCSVSTNGEQASPAIA